MPAKLIEQPARPRLAVEAAPKSAAHPREALPELRRDDIERRAYERFLEHGAQHGHDIDDWLEAERELAVMPRM